MAKDGEKQIVENIAKALETMTTELNNTTKDMLKALVEAFKGLAKGHEEAQKALNNPIIYNAFIDQITAEDLRREGVTEESIKDFLRSSHEEKKEAIDNLDITTVYSLVEAKNISVIEAIRDNILRDITREKASLQAYTPLKNIASNINAGGEPKERTPLDDILDAVRAIGEE